MCRLIEAGHYYQAKGPTEWSLASWEIAQSMKQDGDALMLFIDDVHRLSEIHQAESLLPVVGFGFTADHTVLESSMTSPAMGVLKDLQAFSGADCSDRFKKSDRVRQDKDDRWRFKGHLLTHKKDEAACLLIDAALTLHKVRLGFTRLVNILPVYYKSEQEILIKLIKLI